MSEKTAQNQNRFTDKVEIQVESGVALDIMGGTVNVDGEELGGGAEWAYLGKLTFATDSTQTFTMPAEYDMVRIFYSLTPQGNNRPRLKLNSAVANYQNRFSNNTTSNTTYFDLAASNGSTGWTTVGEYLITGKHASGIKTVGGYCTGNNIALIGGLLYSDSNNLSEFTITASLSTFTGTVEVWGKNLL